MENQQAMTQATVQAVLKVTYAAVKVMTEVGNPSKGTRAVPTLSLSPRTNTPTLKQPTFNQKIRAKSDLMGFKIEVNNIFMTKTYELEESEKVPIIMNWLGCEGLHFLHTTNEEEKEKKCKSSKGLFSILNEKIQASTQ